MKYLGAKDSTKLDHIYYLIIKLSNKDASIIKKNLYPLLYDLSFYC